MEIRLIPLLAALFIIVACVALAACTVVNQPRFGKLPKGEHLDRIKASPNYADGQFQNLAPTPKFSGDAGLISILWSGIFDKAEGLVPESPIPVVKSDLKSLDPHEEIMIWLGHSSWFIQLGGKRFLIDPVLSESAAPFSSLNKAFPGTSIYTADDFPSIDAMLISHDHWDHLDYPTVMALKPKVN